MTTNLPARQNRTAAEIAVFKKANDSAAKGVDALAAAVAASKAPKPVSRPNATTAPKGRATAPRPSAPVKKVQKDRKWPKWLLIALLIAALAAGMAYAGYAYANRNGSAPSEEQVEAWNVWDAPKVCIRDPKLLNIQALQGGRKWVDSPGWPVNSSSAVSAKDAVYGGWCTDIVLASQAAVGVANTPWDGPGSQVFGDFVDFLKPYKVDPKVLVGQFVQPLLPSKNPGDMTEAELKEFADKLNPTWDMVDKLIALHNRLHLVERIEAPTSEVNYHLVSRTAMQVGTPINIEINTKQPDELPAVIFEVVNKGDECIKARFGYNVGDQRFERFGVSDCKPVDSPPGAPPSQNPPGPPPAEPPPGNPPPGGCIGGCPPPPPVCPNGCPPPPPPPPPVCPPNCPPQEGKTPFVPTDPGMLPAPEDIFEPEPQVPEQSYTPDIQPGDGPSDTDPAGPGGVHAVPGDMSPSGQQPHQQTPDVNRPVDDPIQNAPVNGAPSGGTVGEAGSTDPEGGN